MNLALGLIGFVILGTAVVALSLRNLIHAALLLVVSWFGIAVFYLWAGAEFVAFAQVLIYVGAISMVVLFAVLLTRPSPELPPASRTSIRRGIAAFGAGGAVAVVMAYAILRTPLAPASVAPRTASVRNLGVELMGPYAAALLIVGLLLTAALIGAVVIAAAPPATDKEPAP